MSENGLRVNASRGVAHDDDVAFLVLGGDFMPSLMSMHEKIASSVTPRFWTSLLIYPILLWLLVLIPMKKMRQ